ncbi:GT2 family glycosyltransferase [Kluyvera sp. 1366]|jgi:GT2 family glycosyltransferase
MKITALIVTYNRLEKLKKCVAAARLLSFHQIVIVNNASTDDTQCWLESIDEPNINILNSDTNDGGAGGFYKGAKWISENCITDWVLFFDDDAYPDIELLNNFALTDKTDVDAIATKVVDKQGIRCKMNIPWIKFPNTIRDVNKYRAEPNLFTAIGEECCSIISFSFVGVFINSNVLRNTYQNIDKRLFIYFDDVYYSWFLVRQGYKIKYEPTLSFIHDIADRQTVMSPGKIYYLVRNLIWSVHIFGKKKPFGYTSILIRIFSYLLQTIHSESKLKYFKAIIRGVWDGALNKSKISKDGVIK